MDLHFLSLLFYLCTSIVDTTIEVLRKSYFCLLKNLCKSILCYSLSVDCDHLNKNSIHFRVYPSYHAKVKFRKFGIFQCNSNDLGNFCSFYRIIISHVPTGKYYWLRGVVAKTGSRRPNYRGVGISPTVVRFHISLQSGFTSPTIL